MQILRSVWRKASRGGLRNGLYLALLLLLAACGGLLLTDRPGLASEYFALDAPWQGKPLGRGIGAPGLANPAQISDHLSTLVVFSIRWRGWWQVAQGGEHRFFADFDDGGYLRIDDELILEASSTHGERAASGRVTLEPGFHQVEIGFFQNFGDARLMIHWLAPGSGEDSATSLPLADLYGARPLSLRKQLRRVGARWPQPYRQLLGSLLLLTAISLLRGFATSLARGAAGLRERLRAIGRRRLDTALLLALFVFVFWASFPYTGTVVGGDDTSYLDTATFNVKTWYVNRYGHVYLLKLFTALSGGDPFLGARAWWSFVMAATVSALAVAVRSVGPGLQLRTLAVTLFVLGAQPTLWGAIGATFADYSAMMFVTVAAAAYLHGVARDRARPPPRHEWHALLIGALTVGAFRSKEVGFVLLALPALFLIAPAAGFDLRRCLRKVAYWVFGAVAVVLALMLLDGWILGHFFFTWDAGRLASMSKLNFPSGVHPRTSSWLDNLWYHRDMRFLWTAVVAAAVVAGVRRRALQLRLLHLLPIAYLLALIGLYVWLPHPFSDRMLIPILPLACLMAGLLLHDAGLDRVPWRRLVEPAVLIPGGLAAAVICLVVIPLQRGSLTAATLLPVDYLQRYGWQPEQFVAGVLLPVAVLIAGGAAALAAGRRSLRLAALLVVYLVVFGVGFESSRTSLAEKRAVQTSKLLLYPWRAFREELNAMPARTILLSSDLRGYYRMTATTKGSLARLALGRPDVYVQIVRNQATQPPTAIASRETYLAWLQEMPTLAETARFGPSGFLVLLRPQEAAERLRQLPAGLLSEPTAAMSIAQRLDKLRTSPNPAARTQLLERILATQWSSDLRGRGDLFSLLDTRLRAIALFPDGWTFGLSPAGIVVDNGDPSPLRQKITLDVGDTRRELPVQVFIDDGERVETIRFEQAQPRTIELAPVAPFTTRLFIVWSDTAWTPSQRQLGVWIQAPRQL